MEKDEFEKLIGACVELAQEYPEGLVFIGGIAVYLHAINSAAAPFAEFTHDADAFISLSDLGDLRDREELVPNRRLSKHQLIRHGFEFDIYTERLASLIVPYDAVMSRAVKYGELRVAGLEHLLVLKLEAYRDRKASSKGEKDAKDVVRIALVADKGSKALRGDLIAPYLSDEHLRLLAQIKRGSACVALARGNAMHAKRFRAAVAAMAQAAQEAPASRSGPSKG